MKKTVPVILGIVWLILVASFALGNGIDWKNGYSPAACQDGVVVETMTYALERMEDEGILYQINEQGDVEHIFLSGSIDNGSYIAKAASYEDLYGILVVPYTYENEIRTGYRILKFDRNLIPTAESPLLVMEQEGELTGFSVDQDGFYLTLVTDKGQKTYAYHASLDILKDRGLEKAEEEEAMLLSVFLADNSPEGRRIVESRFQEDHFLLRLDDGNGIGDFAVSDDIRSRFNSKKMTLRQTLRIQKERLVFYAEILIAGYMILVLLSMLLRNRNHIIYTIAVTEAVLLTLTSMGTWLVYHAQKSTRLEESRRFGFYYLEELADQLGSLNRYPFENTEFYLSSDYYGIQDILTGFIEKRGVSEFMEDACIARVSDGMVMASASGRNREPVGQMYGEGTVSFLQTLGDGSRKATAAVISGGQELTLLGVAGTGALKPEYILLAAYADTEQAQATSVLVRKYIMFAEFLFLAGSIVCISVLLIQNRELRKLGLAIQSVADGEKPSEKGTGHSRDVDWMWSSLTEIQKRMVQMDYRNEQILRSLSRFVPKRAEELLGKSSVAEMKSGDVSKINGTMAIFASKEPVVLKRRLMDTANYMLSLMEKLIDDRDGYFVPGGGSLSAFRILFLDECRDTVGFAVELMQEMVKHVRSSALLPSVLLHHSSYVYGLVGTEDQCFPFSFSADMGFLKSYSEWLEEMDLHLVITEDVKNREDLKAAIRYIGYIRLTLSNDKVGLYEVLDVCEAQERRKKLMYNDRFQEGLNLFYQHDFFLARSTFSDILKDCPEDQVAKWYLFTCEKYLNQSYSGDFSYEFREVN